jgi:hypothetical protein
MNATSGSVLWRGLVISYTVDTDRSPEGHGSRTTIDRVELDDAYTFMEGLDLSEHPELNAALEKAAGREVDLYEAQVFDAIAEGADDDDE